MTKEIVSIREALLHEALKDVDALIDRISTVDAGLSAKIESATNVAVGRACQNAQLNFKTMIEERENTLIAAGLNASAIINAQINAGATQLIEVNESLERKAWRFIFMMIGIAVIGGVIGGVVAANLISH